MKHIIIIIILSILLHQCHFKKKTENLKLKNYHSEEIAEQNRLATWIYQQPILLK
jgi:hypothetical protein